MIKGHDKGISKNTLIKVYSTLLDSLPHPAMLISLEDKIVLSANKVALDMGVVPFDHCWRGFMKSAYLSNEDQLIIKNYPGVVPTKFDVKCTFCQANLFFTDNPNQNKPCLDAFDKKWDTYWIYCGKGIFLHYAVDITDKTISEELLRKEHLKLENIIEGTRAGTWEWNVQTGDQSINERWAEIIGYSVKELAPISIKTFEKYVDPEDFISVSKQIQRAFDKEIDYYEHEFKMKHKNGSWVWVLGRGKVNTWSNDNKPLIASGTHIDITKIKLAEELIKESETWYKNIFSFERDALFLIEKETGEILDANEAASRIYGYTKDELLMLKNTDVSAEPEKTRIATQIVEPIIPLRYHKKKDGTIFPVEITTGVFERRGHVVIIVSIRDISERKINEDKIEYLSYHDQLTGLYNRRFYEEELKRLDTKRNLPLSIVMADLDGLKLVNDSYGHSIGDEVIKKIAKALCKGCRADDIVARIGGDEFVIILPKADSDMVEKIIARIQKLLLKSNVGPFIVSASFGFDTKTGNRQNIQNIYKNAEAFMYKHKLFESQKRKGETIDLILKMFFKENPREKTHSSRVGNISEAIAIIMKLEEDEIKQVRIAALLHDIGKIGIDKKILNSCRKLSFEELKEIKTHSEIGYRILSAANEYSQIAPILLDHHERWDGHGYPRGLKENESSVAARIIAVADAYDAMTEGRYFKSVLSKDAALNEISKLSGVQFDPYIAKIFIEQVAQNF